MAAADKQTSERLIDGQYAVELSQSLAGAGGGLPAFAVSDRRDERQRLMAVQVPRGVSPRPRELVAARGASGVLAPLAHGVVGVEGGREACFVICQAPAGAALATARAWSESELLDLVLRPAAAALAQLQARQVTHRAIRPDNLFGIAADGRAQPVTLGCAWAEPPASRQPALFEPPYSAMCLPEGRGDGSIADDIYALGVTLVVLALGRMPLAGLEEAEVIRRKLEFGSYAALTEAARLPGLIADLVVGMLAEDPAHRPGPALLLDPAAARARRPATKTQRRAQRSLRLGGTEVWNPRGLAFALAGDPVEGAKALRDGRIELWLRRMLGDPTPAQQVEEALRQRGLDGGKQDEAADAALVLRVVAQLDPRAPIAWYGLCLFPDAIGHALAALQGTPERLARLQELITREAASLWAAFRPELYDSVLRQQFRLLRVQLRSGGSLARVIYGLLPMLPCASKVIEGSCVTTLAELGPALERASGHAGARAGVPADQHIAAFLAARDRASDSPGRTAHGTPIDRLRLLAVLQRDDPAPLPGLATWLAEGTDPMIEAWNDRDRRASLRAEMALHVEAGRLDCMLALLDDQEALAADRQGLRQAVETVGRIDAALAHTAAAASQRTEAARRTGREIAAALALTALAAMLGLTVMG